MNRRTLARGAVLAAAVGLMAGAVPALGVGGPVILGGDDLTDHGSVDTATGNLVDGWLYIQKAIENISPKVGRANDGSIAALGAAPSSATGGDAGAAIGLAAAKAGLTVSYLEGAPAIEQFFADLRAGTVKPRIIWISGNGAVNDMDAAEIQAVTNNAATIDAFVNSGGGLMSHGDAAVYGTPLTPGWLTAILPGVEVVDAGGPGGDLTLTPAGGAAFPGLTDANISSGPWHNHFRGDLGGLDVLATSLSVQRGPQILDAFVPAQVILGGGQVSLTLKPADMGITKTGSPGTITQGGTVTYTMAVTNNGPNPATGVTVTDTLPAGTSFVSASASTGSCSGAATVTCALGDMAVGGTATVTIVARGDSAGTVTNTARVASGVPDTNAANDSATATTTIAAAPAPPPAVAAATRPSRTRLQVTKIGPLAARQGQVVSYRITVRNTGRVAARGVRVRDAVPAGMSLAGVPAGGTLSGGALGWRIPSLAPRSSRSFVVTVRVGATGGTRRCNTATATASNAPSGSDRVCTRVALVAGVTKPAVTG